MTKYLHKHQGRYQWNRKQTKTIIEKTDKTENLANKISKNLGILIKGKKQKRHISGIKEGISTLLQKLK